MKDFKFKTSSFVARNNTGLYANNSLVLITNPNNPKTERIRKDLSPIFNVFTEKGLKITVSPIPIHGT